MKITILSNNTSERKNLVPEHGLAYWIESEKAGQKKAFLFDTGGPEETLISNTKALGVDWSTLEGIVLSHGHYDHTGGLFPLLDSLKMDIPIYLHPAAVLPKLAGPPAYRDIGFRHLNRVKKAGAGFVFSKKPAMLWDDLMTTGEVPRITGFEKVEGFFTVDNISYVPDNIPDDLSLIVNRKERGIFVVCGCCHAGIINTISHAKSLCGTDNIAGIMGGFHLVGADEDRMTKTISALREIDPEVILPLHCTGVEAMKQLRDAFGEKVVFLHCGDHWEI